MDQIKDERPQTLQMRDFENKFEPNFNDDSRDNTPIRHSDQIIDDDKIEVDISGGEPNLNKMIDDLPIEKPQAPLETNMQELQTEVIVHLDTDRPMTGGPQIAKNMEGAPGGNKQFETSKQAHFEQSTKLNPICFRIRRLCLWIGALIALFNFSGDFIYMIKGTFHKGYFLPFLVCIILRYIFCVVISCQSMRRNEVATSMQEKQPEEKLTFMMVTMDFFKDFGGLPLMITMGLYRVLSPRDFPRLIVGSYAIEIFTSLLPLLVLQLLNNQVTKGELSWIQDINASLRLIALFCLIFEMAVMVWELRYNRKMRQLGFPEFMEKTREQKMKRHGKKIAQLSFMGVIVTLGILIFGLYFTDGRTCPESGTVLYWGRCRPCQDQNCADCEHGPARCKACADGFSMNYQSGMCESCNKGSNALEKKCKTCTPGAFGSTECTQCEPGYHLMPDTKQCMSCTEMTGIPNCEQCQGTKCYKCDKNSFFKEYNGQMVCVQCNGQHEFCDECSDSKCNKCKEHIATFDDKGQCHKCTAPWKTLDMQWPHCFCPDILDVQDNFSCKTCNDLLPGCQKCEFTEVLLDNELGRYVGWDPVLSGQGPMYMASTNRLLEPEYVRCIDADNQTAVTIHVEKQQEVNQETRSNGFDYTTQCNEVIPGCERCFEEQHSGALTIGCMKCASGNWLSAENVVFNEKFQATINNECRSCTMYSQYCLECNNRKCTKCQDTYFTNRFTPFCHKCLGIFC